MEHWPLGIVPIRFPAQLDGVFVGQFDRADERRVATVAGHEEHIRICAVVEQRVRDRHGVVACGRKWQPREAEIEQRFPAFRVEVTVGVAEPAGAGLIGARFRTLEPSQLGPYGEGAFDGRTVAADDIGGEVCVRKIGKPFKQAHGGVPRPDVRGTAAHMVIRAGLLEETIDQLVGRRHRLCVLGEQVLERGPSRHTVLAGDGVLHVAQRGNARGVREGAFETRARIGDVVAQRVQPALRFLLGIIEGGPGRDTPGHTLLP
jgi:hypothetical protein